MTLRNLIVFAGFSALVHGVAWAADPAPTTELAGMGGVAAAASEDNGAIAANPGLLALHERYDLQAHFQYGPLGGTRWAASAVDSRTSEALSAGLAYWGDRTRPPLSTRELPGWTVVGEEPDNTRRHHEFTGALAVHGWDRRFAVGLSGTFSIYHHALQGAGSTGNLGVGAGGRPTDWLDLGLAGRNLVPVRDVGELPRSVLAGARVHGEAGGVEADLGWQDGARRPWTAAAGAEVLLGETGELRAGWRYEGPVDQHRISVGASAVGPGGRVSLAAQLPVGGGEPTLGGLAVVAGLTVAAPDTSAPPGY